MGTSALTPANGNAIAASSTGFSFWAIVPIQGRSSNTQLGDSSVFKISNYLANGTRVTGAAPTALGQYRSYLRNASAATYTETNGAPTSSPTLADGIALYRPTAWGTASTNNNPVKYEIFVGKNKNVRFDFFGSSGRTGSIDAKPGEYATSRAIGLSSSYDPTTGIATVVSPTDSNYTNAGYLGWDGTGQVQATGAFFDIVVSENPLFVSSQAVRSEVVLYDRAGYGSSATKVPYFTNSSSRGTAFSVTNDSTNGAKITILEDGVYFAAYEDAFGIDDNFGIQKSASTTTAISSLSTATTTGAGALMYRASGATASDHSQISVPFIASAGDYICPQTDSANGTTRTGAKFRIVKVTN
jgi:hypothetical protein